MKYIDKNKLIKILNDIEGNDLCLSEFEDILEIYGDDWFAGDYGCYLEKTKEGKSYP